MNYPMSQPVGFGSYDDIMSNFPSGLQSLQIIPDGTPTGPKMFRIGCDECDIMMTKLFPASTPLDQIWAEYSVHMVRHHESPQPCGVITLAQFGDGEPVDAVCIKPTHPGTERHEWRVIG